MDEAEKPPTAVSDGGNSVSEDLSTASSTTRVVQIQVVDAPARPPLSRSPSLTLSEATPRTHRSTMSPVSPYFQVHEPLSGYQSDREAIVYKPDSATIQETHMLRNEGVRDVYYTEEHWSSVVKSYVTNAPPKFKQVIKAYRVKSTDKLTLFVEVASQPPSLFQWFCNDRPANSAGADGAPPPPQKRFTVHHGTNVSTLTVEGPDQGVYSCSAQNPAGVSRSYGYITIDDTQSYKEIESTTEPPTPTALSPQIQQSKKRKAPKFLSQIPHFVLKPSEEALIDVEVDSAAAPVKFTWYVDGRQIHDNDENVVVYTPKASRSVAQFRFPSSGQYTVVAQNQYGASKSTGFIEVQTDPTVDTHLYLLQPTAAALPPSSGALSPAAASAAARGRSVTKRTVRTTTFVHRSSSLPRTEFPDGEEVAKLLRRSQTPERTAGVSPEGLLQRQLSGGRPQAPVFITGLPAEIVLSPSERLVLSVEVSASPTADIAWHLDGESVERLDSFRVLTEANRSTLVVDAPVRGGQYGVSAGNGVGQPLTQRTTVRFSIEGSSVSQVTRDTPLETVGELGSGADEVGITKVVVQKEEIIEEHSDSEPEDEEHGDANVFVKTFVDPLRVQTEVDTAAVSVEGGEPPLSPLLQRTTTPQPRAMIPSIVSAPEKQIFVPGGLPLVLELRVSSETPCTIRWYYRNFELRPIAGMITVDESEPNCGRVTYANPPEGIFKAVITNEFGMANFETRVLVEFPEGRRSATGMSLDETAPDFMRRRSSAMSTTPEVSLKMEKRSALAPSEGLDRAPKLILTPEPVYRINDGDTLTLEARADAQPEAVFQWRQNNFEAHNGKQVKIERVDQNHSRAFFEQPAAGRYEVTATNRLGRDSAATKIIVEFEGRDVEKTPKAERKQQMQTEIEIPAIIEKKPIDEESLVKATTAEANADGAKPSTLTLQEEVKGETTNIQKEEESYSLLVKVAESLAQTLVANIFVSAIHTAAKHLADDAKANQVDVGEDDDLTLADSISSAPKITVQTIKLTGVDIEAQVFMEKTDEIFECDVIIEVPEESSVEELAKHSKKSSTERRGSAQKSKIPVKSKPKEVHKDEGTHTQLMEIKEQEDNQLSDFEKSAEQLAEELKQLEQDLRDTGLSPLPAVAEIPATGAEAGQDFEHIEMPTETSPSQVVINLTDSAILEASADELPYDMPATIEPSVEVVQTPKEKEDSRIADSSTPELLDVSESHPGLVESVSSEDEAFYARQRAAVDFPDDMSTSSADQIDQPPVFHDSLRDVQLTAGGLAQLKCLVTGTPTPVVDWFVDGDLINDLTKTESGRTIKSFENDEIQYFQYESEPSVRASGNATAEFGETGDATPLGEKVASADENLHGDSGYEKIFADLLRGRNTENRLSVSNNASMKRLSIADNIDDIRRDSLAQNSIHSASSRRTTTSAEFSESVFNAPTPSVEVDTEPAVVGARPTRAAADETPTASLMSASERNANRELVKMFEEYEEREEREALKKAQDKKNKLLASGDEKCGNDMKGKQSKNKWSSDSAKTLSLPRKLTLPDKVTYKGERINMQISGPVHILTANIHHHHHHHHGRHKNNNENSLSLKNESSGDSKVVEQLKHGRENASPLEKYVESLCDFTSAFDELGQRLVRSAKAASHAGDVPADVRRIAPAKKTTSFTYRVSAPHVKASIERPASAPYLVQTNSYCHLARVIEITQEWRLECQPQVGTASRTLYDGLKWRGDEESMPNFAVDATINDLENDRPDSCFEDTKFDTLKKQNNKVSLNENIAFDKFPTTFPMENQTATEVTSENFTPTKNGRNNITPIVVVEPPQPPPIPPRFLHKTQSAVEMPESRARDYFANIHSAEFNSLRRTIDNVEENLESARLYTKESRNREARRIERAILDISERLSVQHVPLTRAQAEANEELLRTRMAEMILDIRDDPGKSGYNASESSYDYGILREPLNILRNKLSFLEQFVEEEDSIKEELSTIVQLPKASRHSNIIQKRERALKRRGEEIARMTPLFSVVKQKLGSVEDVIDRGRSSGRVTPYQERKTVHNLMTGINAEINTIHALCRENSGESGGVDSLNTVVSVLSRMCVSLDAIMDAMRFYTIKEKDEDGKTVISATTTNRGTNDVHCHIDISKDEEQESVLSFIIHFGSGIRPITPRLRLNTSIRRTSNTSYSRIKKENESIYLRQNSISHRSQRSKSDSNGRSKEIPQIHRIASREKSSLAIPEPTRQPRNKTYVSASPRDVGCSLNVSLLRRDRFLDVARTFRMEPMGADIVLNTVAPYAIVYESDDFTPRPKTQSASCRGGHAADVGESSDFGDASSFVSDENFYADCQNQNGAQEPLDIRQELSESPRAAKYFRHSRPVDEADSASLQSRMTSVSALVPEILLNDDESFSEAMTLSVPILFRRSERETEIISDEDAESNFVYVYNLRSSCTETFNLRRRNKRAVLNAIVYPEIRAEIAANVASDAFEVDVVRVDESDRQSVVMIMVSEEYYSKKVKITRKLDPIEELIKQLGGGEDDDASSRKSRQTDSDDNEDEDDEDSVRVETLAKLNVSIMARSVRDSVLAHLEEIPWGEVAICLPTDPAAAAVVGDVMTTSNISQQTNATSGMARDTASVVSNIVVNENHDEVRSLAPSHRSGGSMRSLATMSLADVDIPAYVIKQGSTASITCEMNAYVQRRETIEWYRGREPIDLTDKRYDRISHDLIEVLVILRVDVDDGQLYSIKVHDEVYPVAYLIIEDAGCETPKPTEAITTESDSTNLHHAFFVSPPQTMFVMQGQTAIVSCQMSVPDLDVIWYRESERICAGDDDRIFFERTPNAWYRIIIEDVDFVDQGVYYAFYHDRSTTINLIVEERIDEREVQVSSAETDDDELSDYLVPIGSTATIACELDGSTALAAANAGAPHRLRWQRDNVDIPTAEVGASDAPARRFEHVQNENKHYLIVHNAQPADSGVYSVLVNGVRFKVAQITIGQHGLLLKKSSQQSVSITSGSVRTPQASRRRPSTSRVKRISNTSLVP